MKCFYRIRGSGFWVWRVSDGMGSSPHRRKLSGTVKLFTMEKPKSKPPARESVTGYLPQDILDQLKELDVGVCALTLQIGAEKMRRLRRTEMARKGIKL